MKLAVGRAAAKSGIAKKAGAPLPKASGQTTRITTSDLLRNGLRERGTGLLPRPRFRYAPRLGRFGLRAGGPTIFSGPSRSPT